MRLALTSLTYMVHCSEIWSRIVYSLGFSEVVTIYSDIGIRMCYDHHIRNLRHMSDDVMSFLGLNDRDLHNDRIKAHSSGLWDIDVWHGRAGIE